jgi:hypothetical protein
MKRMRGLLLLVVVVGSIALGMIALSAPVEAAPSHCFIRCALGVCERCCQQKGGWVCT